MVRYAHPNHVPRHATNNDGIVYGDQGRGYGRAGRGNYRGNHGGHGNPRRRAIVYHAYHNFPINPVPSQTVLNAFDGYRRELDHPHQLLIIDGAFVIEPGHDPHWRPYHRVRPNVSDYEIILGDNLGPGYRFDGTYKSAYDPVLFSPRTPQNIPAIILCDRCFRPFTPGIQPVPFFQNLTDHQNANNRF